MIAKTATRVEEHTNPRINELIDLEIERSISIYKDASPELIHRRLAELDKEWDIERAIETNASAAMMGSLILGKAVNRRFFALGAVVAGFLLQHALQGWCPPVPVLRRLGFRTAREIEKERRALLGYLALAPAGKPG